MSNQSIVTKIIVKYPKGLEPNVIIPSKYTSYRYLIGHDGPKPLICIGMNPSAAKEEYSDRTVNKVIKYANDNNYDGWYMLNIYPQRATNAKLHLDMEFNKQYHQDNMDNIIKIIKEKNVDEIWGAWGDIDEKRKWLNDVKNDIINLLKKNNIKIFYFNNLTKKYNNPPHPLYLKLDNKYKKYL